jgi:hypothetical protein
MLDRDWAFGHRVLAGGYSLALALRLHPGPGSGAAWQTFRRRWQDLVVPEQRRARR